MSEYYEEGEETYYEEPVEPEPVYEEPVEPEPVYEEPAAPAPEPVYEETAAPAPEPEPAPAPEPEPVVEEPAPEPEPEPEPVVEEAAYEEPAAEETTYEEEATYEEEPLAEDETVYEEETVAEEPIAEEGTGYEEETIPEQPVAQEETGYEETASEAEGVQATEDSAGWDESGPPEEWDTTWEPPVEESADSWMDCGCSTDWGVVSPDWAVEGEPLIGDAEQVPALSALVGPGHAADVHWADQGQTNYCGLYSVSSILSETGTVPDMQEMVDRAAENGWLVYEGGEIKGIRPEDLDDILNSYGVESSNRVGEDGAWQSLNDALANNQRMVIGLDAKELDAQASVGDDPFTGAGVDMDHFVAVTGIDYDRGVVIVNDSARGAGLEIPVDVFYESWRDSGFSMTVTGGSMPGDAVGADPAAEAPAEEEGCGFAALGMTLQPEFGEIYEVEDVAEEPASTEPTAWEEEATAYGDVCCGDVASAAPAESEWLTPAPAVAEVPAQVAPVAAPAGIAPLTTPGPMDGGVTYATVGGPTPGMGQGIVAVDPVAPASAGFGQGIIAVDPAGPVAPAPGQAYGVVGSGFDGAKMWQATLDAQSWTPPGLTSGVNSPGGFLPGGPMGSLAVPGFGSVWATGQQVSGTYSTADPRFDIQIG